MRTIFLGSPPFATSVLARLVETPYRPVLVLTQPARARGRGLKVASSPVAELARAGGIELLEAQSVRDPVVLARLSALEPDVFLVVSYGELLRREFLEIPRQVALNVHPSLLPRHRGATPIQAALLSGDEVTGVTIQKIARELDAGDILLARELAILPGENAGELAARLAALSAELVPEALRLVDRGEARYRPQDGARATYCRKLEREAGRVDWTRPALELERQVRAFNPWPGAFTRLPAGGELLLRRARAVERPALDASAPPGTVLVAEQRLIVAAGPGPQALELLELQAAGKRALAAPEFLRGARLAPGSRLGGC